MSSFDWISFVIGLLAGMIIMLCLIWLAYYERAFLFTYCPTQARKCAGGDYYNNPGDALANGADINNILFVNDKNELYYRRVQKNGDCIPESNQIVRITYPQYCNFENTGGVGETWIDTGFNNNIYKNVTNNLSTTIITNGNCDPITGSQLPTGYPLIRWNINPIND